MTDDARLIARYIEPDPNHPGPGDVRLVDSAIPVWAIVGQLAANHWRVDVVAGEYSIPVAEVRASLAYYRQCKEVIDARLAANSGLPLPTAVGVPA